MNTLLKLLGLVTLGLSSFFYSIFILLKIYAITLIPLGAPQVNGWKLYGIMLFLSAANLDVAKYGRDAKDDREYKTVINIISHAVAITAMWGMAYWVCG